MKKYKKIFQIIDNQRLSADCVLMKLRPCDGNLPLMQPGQFVNILTPSAPGTFLRRPISICNVKNDELWLFIKNVGKGSEWLVSLVEGDTLDIILPLGNGWSYPESEHNRSVLLIGGGVGTAPLLYWGERLKENGYIPEFLLGGANADALNLLDEFKKTGTVHITTDDGSAGVKGTVLAHPVVNEQLEKFGMIYCCGPTPMMKAVAAAARQHSIVCEVSLENHMACGIGACLCCVEDTKDGHKCVCTTGPVFNIKDLKGY